MGENFSTRLKHSDSIDGNRDVKFLFMFRNNSYEFLLKISRLQLPIWKTCFFMMANFDLTRSFINNHPAI
jgi:hypothetical protein